MRGSPLGENTLLVIGAVVAALALLALFFASRGYHGAPPRPRVALAIVPTLDNAQLAFEATNTGRTEAREIHAACIVRGAGAWPTLTLHAPPAGSSLGGEDLAGGAKMEIALGACMNASDTAGSPRSAYFFVRYFTGANEEHVEETLLEFPPAGASANGYRSVDPADVSQTYRWPLLQHLRKYAPPN
jgi:hypothetical protein